jgi:ribokinase
MAEPAQVVVVGSLHYDIMVRAPYLPRPGETLIGERWWWKPGGKGGNAAMAAARHGAAVEMVGCLGEDGFGERLRERMAAAGVGLGNLRSVEAGSGMSVAITQEDGDYAAVVVSGANRGLDAAQVAASAGVIRDSHVLLLQNEIDEQANVAAAQLARAAGTSVILNAAPARPLGAMVGLVDVLVVNTVEAEMLGAGPVANLAAAADAAHRLSSVASTVIVTAGAAGVAAASGEESWRLHAFAVNAPDAHGAGDVFVGALAARLAGDAPLADALRYANAAAALHVGTPETERASLGTAAVEALLASSARGTVGS